MVTSGAEAHQVAVGICQLRILVQVLDVVDGGGLYRPAVPLAVLALVAVPPQDSPLLPLPFGALIKFTLLHRTTSFQA